MRNWRLLVGIVLIGAVAAAGWAYAQGRGGSGELTGQDIAEIERLYYRYAQGLDFQDEELYVSAYAEDAVFTTGAGEVWEGHEGLRARFRQRPGAEGTGITHVTVNIIVKGTRRAPRAAATGSWSTPSSRRPQSSGTGTTSTRSRAPLTVGGYRRGGRCAVGAKRAGRPSPSQRPGKAK